MFTFQENLDRSAGCVQKSYFKSSVFQKTFLGKKNFGLAFLVGKNAGSGSRILNFRKIFEKPKPQNPILFLA